MWPLVRLFVAMAKKKIIKIMGAFLRMYSFITLCLFVASLYGQRRPRPFSAHLKHGPLASHASGDNSTGGGDNIIVVDGISPGMVLLLIGSLVCLICLCAEYVRRARKRHQNRVNGGGGV